jgi:hypothetical protein
VSEGNWKADPVACAIRLKTERGCTILAGRNEVMSRSTICYRTEEPDGVYWRHGHLYARREGGVRGDPKERIVAGRTTDSTGRSVELSFLGEHANTMSDLLRAAYSNNGGHSCGGTSLYEMIWDEMMTITDRLMTGQEAEDDVGAARATAYVLAIMQNPYRPNVDAVKEQVMDKWYEGNPE